MAIVTPLKIFDIDKCGCSSVNYSYVSFAPSTMTLAWNVPTPADRLNAEQFLQEVRITRKGKTLIQGYVTKTPQMFGHNTGVQQVQISDYFYALQNSHCLGAISASPVISFGITRSDLNGNPVRDTAVNVRDFLEYIFSACTFPAKWRYDGDERDPVLPMSGTGKYGADYLREFSRQVPGLVTYFDYSKDTPELVIASYKALPIKQIQAGDCKSTNLTPRPDLRPPCVAIFGQAYGAKKGDIINIGAIVPEGGDPQALHAVVHNMAIVGNAIDEAEADEDGFVDEEPGPLAADRQVMSCKGRIIPNGDEAIAWWGELYPSIIGKGVISLNQREIKPAPADATGEEIENLAQEPFGIEMTEGLISTKNKGIKWCNAYVYDELAIPEAAIDSSVSALFPERVAPRGGTPYRKGKFGRKLRTINKLRHDYRLNWAYKDLTDVTEEEEEEKKQNMNLALAEFYRSEYRRIAEQYYADTRPLIYDGSFTYPSTDPQEFIGQRLQITGANPDWAAMEMAFTQSISHNLNECSLSIQIGTATHLTIDERLNRDRGRYEQIEQQQANATPSPASPSGQLDWEYPNKRVQAPTLGPIRETISPAALDNREFPCQVVAVKDKASDGVTTVTTLKMRSAKIMLNGVYCGHQIISDGGGEWIDLPTGLTAVWLNIRLQGGNSPATSGVMSHTITGTPDASLAPPTLTASMPGSLSTAGWSIHIADIRGDLVIQRQVGDIHLQVDPGTFYPYGPS